MFDEKTRHQLGACARIKSGMSDEQKSEICDIKNPELDQLIKDLKKRHPEKFLMGDADLHDRVFFDEPANESKLKSFIRPYKPVRLAYQGGA